MLLIFSLCRPDVLSWAIWASGGEWPCSMDRELNRERFERRRKRYAPYSSAASFYLSALEGRGNACPHAGERIGLHAADGGVSVFWEASGRGGVHGRKRPRPGPFRHRGRLHCLYERAVREKPLFPRGQGSGRRRRGGITSGYFRLALRPRGKRPLCGRKAGPC